MGATAVGSAAAAEQDARAVELGLAPGGRAAAGAACVGDPQLEALRAYLGMGLDTRVLERSALCLMRFLCWPGTWPSSMPQLGDNRYSGGNRRRLRAFLLAEQLGWPLVVGLAAVERVENGVWVLQALPRG
jgi:electron transfer flavoprotein beta subunit